MSPEEEIQTRGSAGDLMYKTAVKTEEDLFDKITVAAGTIADTTITGPTMYCVYSPGHVSLYPKGET